MDDFEWPALHVFLDDGRVVKITTTNKPFSIMGGVGGIHHIFSSFTNVYFTLSEDHTGMCGPVAVVIIYDLHMAVLENGHAGVGGTQVNSNSAAMFLIKRFTANIAYIRKTS